MTKKEIISEVTGTTGLTHPQASKAYDAIIEAVRKSLAKGENVTLRGFATLKVVRKKKRVSHLYEEDIIIPAHNAVKFKACQKLKRQMNHG